MTVHDRDVAVVAFDRFQAEFLDFMFEVGPKPVGVDAGTQLIADLEFDSLDLFRVVVFVEDMADLVLLEVDEVPVPETLGDLYELYAALVAESVRS